MSAAQLLILTIGLALSGATFILMRRPQHRREQYRGAPFSTPVSVIAAVAMLLLSLVLVWAQGQYEASLK